MEFEGAAVRLCGLPAIELSRLIVHIVPLLWPVTRHTLLVDEVVGFLIVLTFVIVPQGVYISWHFNGNQLLGVLGFWGMIA